MDEITLAQVCERPSDFLGTLDIAALNLMCAVGLPGAENIDPPRYQAWMDDAARAVEFMTQVHWHHFNDSPESCQNSPGYFCCGWIIQTLQLGFGVRYNPARVTDPKFQDPKCVNPDFSDSRDL